MMKRRKALQQLGLVAGASLIGPSAMGSDNLEGLKTAKKSLRIAHITDVHIRPEHDAPSRFKKCVKEILTHKVDFVLNGGDTIYAADYGHITRERVNEQWNIWQELSSEFSEFEIFSCLGNHDMWWAAPNKDDNMYGKPHVVKQLGIPKRYYHFAREGWNFIILDSNNKNAGSLDPEQREWLEKLLTRLPAKSNILVMSHYPILGACTHIDGGNHTDSKYISKLFYQHNNKNISCISGHIHLLDKAEYNGVNYYCNGALSGFWWEDGDKDSAGKYWYHETPPGYAIIDLYQDGRVENKYYPHQY